MKKFLIVVLVSVMVTLTACSQSPAAPTATNIPPTATLAPTLAPSPTPVPPTVTPMPTATPKPDVTAYLLAHGLTLNSAQPKCDTPCKEYSNSKSGVTAVIYENGKAVYTFLLTNEAAVIWVGNMLPDLYGNAVFEWFSANLVAATMIGPQTGYILGYSVRVEDAAKRYFKILTITPE